MTDVAVRIKEGFRLAGDLLRLVESASSWTPLDISERIFVAVLYAKRIREWSNESECIDYERLGYVEEATTDA